MSNSPFVSIITPTYNHERFLSSCIDSVLNQSYSNWEMIIVNDGSTDSTLSIAKKYEQLDSRIKVYNRSNVGIFRLSETYNFALSVASGKYIAILEGDDTWEKNKLTIQIQGLETNSKAILSWGNSIAANEYGTILSRFPNQVEDTSQFNNTPVGSIMHILIFRNVIPALTIMIRKSSLESIGGFQQKFGLPLVDIPTLHSLSLQGEFIYITDVLGTWRIYSNQITKTFPVQIYKGYYELAKEFYSQNTAYSESLGISRKEIDDYFLKMLVIAHSRSGRYNLLRKKYANARKDYFLSIFHFGLKCPAWKLRSMIGLVFSFFHLNIEWLAKLLGRPNYH